MEQGATHLEDSKFVESMKTYIEVGFRGSVPTKGVWMYLSPFLAWSWWVPMRSREVQEKTLEEILEAITEESAWVNPVHARRIELKQLQPQQLPTEVGGKNRTHRI